MSETCGAEAEFSSDSVYSSEHRWQQLQWRLLGRVWTEGSISTWIVSWIVTLFPDLFAWLFHSLYVEYSSVNFTIFNIWWCALTGLCYLLIQKHCCSLLSWSNGSSPLSLAVSLCLSRSCEHWCWPCLQLFVTIRQHQHSAAIVVVCLCGLVFCLLVDTTYHSVCTVSHLKSCWCVVGIWRLLVTGLSRADIHQRWNCGWSFGPSSSAGNWQLHYQGCYYVLLLRTGSCRRFNPNLTLLFRCILFVTFTIYRGKW